MLLVALIFIARYGRNIPLSEDWSLVPPLTGHESNLPDWLWAQNNEHRLPLPKLLLLLLLICTGGDFRAGMVFNALVLGALAFVMIRVAGAARGGTIRCTDAFFPLLLLHLGHWANLGWGWQVQFVMSTCLVCILLIILVGQHQQSTTMARVEIGIVLILLPLCGASGLILVPPMALWLGFDAIYHLRLVRLHDSHRWGEIFSLGCAVIALLLVGIYFIGYERPAWNPPSPSIEAALKTSVKFLALGFGPAAANSWRLSSLAVSGLLLAGIALMLYRISSVRWIEQRQAIGLLLFLGGMGILALCIGWGRAAQVPRLGLPLRYVLLAVPALCAIYFIWELYSPTLLRQVVPIGLLIAMLVLMPLNTHKGLEWKNWYLHGMDAVTQDLRQGVPRTLLAERHYRFLLHWNQAELVSDMQMLHQAGIGPFREMQED